MTDRILRAFDIFFSLLGILICLPLFLIIAILIKLDSKGPVFFKQDRIGKDHKCFSLYKFRSMRSDSKIHLLLTTKNDLRITSVGLFIRKYKIDELPQLYNVLKGDMSLVGPRPDVKKYVDQYTKEQRIVLGIKPGITDYASIHFSNETEMLLEQSDPEKFYIEEILPKKIKLNLIYINQRGIKSYFKIIFLTIGKVVNKAYREIIKSGKLNLFFLLLVFFTLPINRHFFTIALWPWILSWFLEGDFRTKFSMTNLKKNRLAFFFLVGSYSISIISLLWTNNIAMGFHNLGTQTSLVIFPIFFGFTNPIIYTKSAFRSINISFVCGAFVVTVYLLIKSIIYSFSISGGSLAFNPAIGQGDNVFYYEAFSRLMHPTYYGMMVLLSASICFIDVKMHLTSAKYNYIKILAGLFFLVMIFFISARSVIIAATVLVIWLLINNYLKKKSLLISTIIIIMSLIVISLLHPRLRYLIAQYNKSETIKEIESINERGIIWNTSFQIIKKNMLLGVGIGDVEDDLDLQFKKNGHDFGTFLNAHNQFIEQWLTAGLLSLLMLIAGLILPVFMHTSINKVYYISFMIICIFTFMFESTLRRFTGVAFFSIFYTLLTRYDMQYSVTNRNNYQSEQD